MYLRATVAVVNAEEMKGRDLGGGLGAGSRTTADVAARTGHESRNYGNRILHLFSSPNHRSMSPTHYLVLLPHALLPHRRRHRNLHHLTRRRAAKQRWHKNSVGGRNLAGAAADRGNVAGAGDAAAAEVLKAKHRRNAGTGTR